GQSLGGEISSRRVPNACLIVGIVGDVSRTRHDKYLAVVYQRHVNGIDGHQVGMRLPLPLDLRLRYGRNRNEERDQNSGYRLAHKCLLLNGDRRSAGVAIEKKETRQFRAVWKPHIRFDSKGLRVSASC